MRNISLTQMLYALTLQETKNFSLAAKKCHVTQPTLSMQLQKLEDELGIILFDRTKQPIIPTDPGEKLLAQFRTVVQETQQIDDILTEVQGEVSGEFRLAILPSIAPYLVPLFAARFVRSYPKVTLILDECMTQTMVERLKKDEYDAGILVTPLEEESIYETPLYYEPFWGYVSQGHPLFIQKEISGADLGAADLWILEEGHCFRDQVLSLCKRRKGQWMTKSPLNFQSGSLESLKGLVDSGIGYTLLPDLAARQIVLHGNKKRLRAFTKPTPVREVSCVQVRKGYKKKILDALVQTVKEGVPRELLKRDQTKLVPLK